MSQQFLRFLIHDHMMKYDRPPHVGHDKFTLKSFQWVDGNVKVIEEGFQNLNKAQRFADSLGQCDCHIKIYNQEGEVVFSEKRGSAANKDPELYA